MAVIDISARPPAEAVRFFESKGFAIGFDWRDIWQQEHARAFTVAKVMRLDILQDIRGEVDRAIRQGTTLADFKKRLTPLLQEKGWWGRTEAVDPLTGEIRNVQLGSPRRLNTIFDTNVRTAHAAGRWERIERTKGARPFLLYVAVIDDRTRPEHRAWHHIVRPVDDSFWSSFYPPNGWHCRCIVRQLSQRDLDRRGFVVSSDAEVSAFMKNTRRHRNKRTGKVESVPKGISPGFNYNVGKAHMRALTPPPATGPINPPRIISQGNGTPLNLPSTSPMPEPRPASPDRLLPRDLTDEEYVGRFLSEFGASAEKPVVFTDALGERLVISEDLFRDRQGRLKPGTRRRQSMLLLADAIRDPDEIWWHWEENKVQSRAAGEPVYELRRRYLARRLIDGQEQPLIAVFDVGESGWHGVTGVASARVGNLVKSRAGVLAWRRN